MTRLVHSYAAFRRSMQMSRVQLFVFVEGRVDRFFYGAACELVCRGTPVQHTVRSIHEVSGTGGKEELLSFFKYLRSRGSLIDDFKGKRTATIFFADKDLDDVCRRRLRSRHLVYTIYYNVENHIFVHSDLARATASAASIDLPTARSLIGLPSDWRRQVALRWKEWVKLCFHAVVHDIRSMCTYASLSKVNNPPFGPVDPRRELSASAVLEKGSGVSHADFTLSLANSSARVERIYQNNRYETVFNGKWYFAFMVYQLLGLHVKPPVSPNGLAERLVSALVLTLDYTEPWASWIVHPLQTMVAELHTGSAY